MKNSILFIIALCMLSLAGCVSTDKDRMPAQSIQTFDTFTAVYDLYPLYVSNHISEDQWKSIRNGDISKVHPQTIKYWGVYWTKFTLEQKQDIARVILDVDHQGE